MKKKKKKEKEKKEEEKKNVIIKRREGKQTTIKVYVRKTLTACKATISCLI